MRKLSRLIRLHKSKLEARRLKVARLEGLFDGLMGEVRGLEGTALREGRMVSDAPDSGYTLGGFLQSTRERKRISCDSFLNFLDPGTLDCRTGALSSDQYPSLGVADHA